MTKTLAMLLVGVLLMAVVLSAQREQGLVLSCWGDNGILVARYTSNSYLGLEGTLFVNIQASPVTARCSVQ